VSDRMLETQLEGLGAYLDAAVPSGTFAERVINRIETEAARPVARTRRRWVAIALAAVLLALVAVVAAQPAARKAIADFLGIGGIRIRQQSTPRPTPSQPSPTARYVSDVLGTQVSLAEARQSVGFPVRVPKVLGDPDAVFFDPSIRGGEVNLTYNAGAEFPESTVAEVGLIIGEFEGGLASEFLRKTVGAEAVIEESSVNGRRAFWIEGAHELTFRDSNGQTVARRSRLSGSVLIWRDDQVTYRLEGQISKEKATSIAESIS
jgi:hypothetical protein